VIVDVMRGGPGLGNIQPSQSDYYQVTRSAGHGDFHLIVLAPASVQEAIDLTVLAFDLADQYRHMVMLEADGQIGQMMEPAELPPMQALKQAVPAWALRGAMERKPNRISSLHMKPEEEEGFNLLLQDKLHLIQQAEQRSVELYSGDMDLLVIGFGTAGRIALTAVEEAREKGLKVGWFRPISLWPFPEKRLRELRRQTRQILVVEMNAGQMIDDVRLAVEGVVPVSFFGRMGGMVPMPDEILAAIEKQLAQEVVR
jgi:2-oxoglutarate ferredoxin oxidoreductase subunit alpha